MYVVDCFRSFFIVFSVYYCDVLGISPIYVIQYVLKFKVCLSAALIELVAI